MAGREVTDVMHVAQATSPAAYTAGAVSTVYGTLSTHDLAVWVGLLCTVGTFVVNLWFQMRADARAEEDAKGAREERLIRTQSYHGPERRGRGAEGGEAPVDPPDTAPGVRASEPHGDVDEHRQRESPW